MKKSIILFTILLFCFFRFEGIKTDILDAFLNPDNPEQAQLLQLSKTYSSTLNIIIESDNKEALVQTKSELSQNTSQFDDLVEVYKSSPTSFLTEHKRELLKAKRYQDIAAESNTLLYNPLGIMIQTPDKDPYLFVTDYVLSLQNLNKTEYYNGKYYDKISVKISDNNDIKKLEKFQSQNSKIYLCGSPIHTYKTSQKSALEINIICIISTLVLLFLCKTVFNSYKIFFPIALSVLCGYTTGILSTIIVFKSLHVLTIVFGTSLIGISLDYSFHYIISKNKVIKNLTVSMLTTVIAFLLLIFSNVELIKQIGIFTATGLVGVYSFIMLLFPKFQLPDKHLKLPEYKYSPKLALIPLVIMVLGLCHISFSDDIKTFYTPQKELLKAEKLNSEVFNTKNISFLITTGKNLDDTLLKQERLKKELNVKTLSISDFIPSAQKREENETLVKELYKTNLDNYATFLSKEQRNKLKTEKATIADISELSIVKQFSLNKNTLYMIAFDKVNRADAINLTSEISNIIKNIRIKSIRLIPFVFLIYFMVLSICYNPKKALKIMISPTLAAIFSITFAGLFQPINVFHILSVFLILGFSIDYSIFMANCGKTSKDAVLISFITSFISFILLSFTSFKLISSMGLVISVGIATSYILSSLLFSEETETK